MSRASGPPLSEAGAAVAVRQRLRGAAAPDPRTGVVPEKRNKTIKDMVWSIGLLAVVVLAAAGIYGFFSFSPGRPTEGPVPQADVAAEFAKAPRVLPFTPVVPTDLPDDWQGSSALISRGDNDPGVVRRGHQPSSETGTPATVRGGWQTPDGFISLVASNAAPEKLLADEFGTIGADAGTVQIGRQQWTVTTGVRDESAWYTTLGSGSSAISYLITGSASPAAFRTLAEAIAR
ncbi:DUF4245 family protein [Nakamurella aerolata]|uniref:DUF4245 domain-containing protein n=1 Tax=Nakamurella aerolata TaxID=1656892 RepID=A0A849A404_9ACTN|nr:DUF4245 domain-containing protein [Nakamurella aerolata]